MIARTHRFHGYNSLKFVYRQGVISRGPLFAVKALHNPRRDSYRAAVVVSRKVSKSAVVRNRIRRLIFQAIQSLEPQIDQSYDIVVTVFSDDAEKASSPKLQSQLKKQILEAGAMTKPKS